MTLWAEGFQKQYPNVRIQIEGKGSSTAPPALISGTAQLGPMSREMKAEEIDEFEKKYGYKPTAIRSRSTPSRSTSTRTTRSSSSPCSRSTRSSRRPASAAARTSRPGATSASAATGRRSRSASTAATRPPAPTASSRRTRSARATTGHRQGAAGLGLGRAGRHRGPVTASATAASATRPRASSRSRWRRRRAAVRRHRRRRRLAGKYPLARFLYVYVNKAPNKPLDPLVREFVKFVLSQRGPGDRRQGRLPAAPAKIVEEELAKLK